jgi:WD40 repeat protein
MEGQRIRQHLTAAADGWDTLGRPDSELYRGVRLTQALQWRERADTRLTATEIAFLDASERAEQSERRAEQVRARAQTHLIRRLRVVLAVAVVLLVVALSAGLVALEQQDRAERNASRAVANAAAAVASETRAEARRASALALSSDDIDESMLLAVAGVRLADSPETRSSLLAAIGRHPELIGSLQMSGPEVRSFDVSPDESAVATYDATNRVRLYDVGSGALVAQLQAGSTARVNWVSRNVRFSPDGRTLAVSGAAPARDPVALLDAQTLAPLPRQPRGTGGWRWQVNDITFSHDGRRLASNMFRVRGHGDTTHAATSAWSFVWDLDAPDHPVARLRLDSGGVSVALDAHGRTLYTAQPLLRHDLDSGRTVQLPEPWGADGPVEIVAMSPTARALAGSGAGGVAILDPRTGAVRRQMQVEPDDDGYWVSFSGDGHRVAVLDFTSSEALVWQVASGDLLARLPLSDAGEFTALGATGATLYSVGSDSALRQWDIDGDHRFVSQVAYAPLGLGDLSYVRPSPDGRFLAYPAGDDVAFFDVTTGKIAATVTQDSGYRRRSDAQWDPDGVHFAAATDGEIRVWDARTGRLVVRARPAGRYVSALDYSTDGSRLVIGELSGQVTMLDSADLTPVGRPARLDHPVRGIASGPDNRTAIALTGFESASGFWIGSSPQWARLDLETGDVVTVRDLGFDAGTVDASPDGTHVALGGRTGELMVLDLATDEPVRAPVTVHDVVVDVSYSEDGSRLLTSGFDYKNALWDGRTGELLARVVTSQLVTEATFTGDGDKVLIAPLWAGAVLEWDTRPDHAVEFACLVAGRDFTEAEWAEVFGDRPYQPICPRAEPA